MSKEANSIVLMRSRMQRTTNNENYKRIEIGLLKSHEESLCDLFDTNEFVTYDTNLGKGIKSRRLLLIEENRGSGN